MNGADTALTTLVVALADYPQRAADDLAVVFERWGLTVAADLTAAGVDTDEATDSPQRGLDYRVMSGQQALALRVVSDITSAAPGSFVRAYTAPTADDPGTLVIDIPLLGRFVADCDHTGTAVLTMGECRRIIDQATGQGALRRAFGEDHEARWAAALKRHWDRTRATESEKANPSHTDRP